MIRRAKGKNATTRGTGGSSRKRIKNYITGVKWIIGGSMNGNWWNKIEN